MGDPAGVLQDQVHVTLLAERMIGRAVGSQREDQRLVVGEDLEVAALEERHEVPHGQVHGEQLASEGAVAALGRRELPGEEAERLP